MTDKEIEKAAEKYALREFPYTNEGNVEDEVDNAKRCIYRAAFIIGALEQRDSQEMLRIKVKEKVSIPSVPEEERERLNEGGMWVNESVLWVLHLVILICSMFIMIITLSN